MTAGVPGTGIGGLFYVASALAIPLREGYRRLRGRPASVGWRFVAGQTALAAAIVAGMWGAGWLLGIALRAAHSTLLPVGDHATNVVRTATLALTVGTLGAVLGGVELLRAVVAWIERRRKRALLVVTLGAAVAAGRAAAAQESARGGGGPPVVTPLAGGSRDSDGNATFRLGAAVDLAASATTRLGVAASRVRVTDGVSTAALEELALRGTWRPRKGSSVEASAGLVRTPRALASTGQVRARWRGSPAGRGPALDFRARRGVLDGTPRLLANGVTRTELGGGVELPVAGGLKARALGLAAVLEDSVEANPRTTLGGALALSAAPGVEVSGQYREVRHAHPSAAGYFAPRLVQVIEAGSYVEVETARSLLVILDVGAGAGRVAAQGASLGPWRPALRGYALVALPLAAGSELRFELEVEDSPGAGDVATSPAWRYGSAALSLRWALP